MKSETSANEPLVLVPGLGCTEKLFDSQRIALGVAREVHIVDHSRDDSMAGIAARFLADAPERFALAGLSMGGYAALEILFAAPERVTRLALLDTSAHADTTEATANRHRLVALARQDGLDAVHASLWPRLVHPDRQGDAALEAIVHEMLLATGVEAFARQQQAIMTRTERMAELTAIRVPALVIVGEGDIITPPAIAHAMAEAISSARLVVVEACGHLSTLEKPDTVTAAMRDWLAA